MASAKSPKLDPREHDAIVQQARDLAPFYVSEWDVAEETGAGAALLKIVARLLEGIIRRLNDVPLKHFIAFLESIGIKLLPALPARAPLTFFLSTGAKEAVVVPARSQVAAKPPGEPDPVIFETEKTILATPAKLQAIVSVVPATDQIVDHATPLAKNVTTELFSQNETNLQSHILYLGHDDLFNVKSPAQFLLTFNPPLDLTNKPVLKFEDTSIVNPFEKPRVDSAEERFAWEYWGEKEKNLDWHAFDQATFESNRIKLKKESEAELTPLEVNKVTSRWIRCRFIKALSKSDRLANLDVRDIRIGAPPLPSDAAGEGWVDPDAAFYNDLPLTVPLKPDKPLTPFGPPPKPNPDGGIAGTRPRPGDVFYLASQDAFSKRGSMISIKVGVSATAASIDIERVHGIGPITARRLRAKNINTVEQFLRLSARDVAAIIKEENPTVPVSRNLLESAFKQYLDKVVTSDPVSPAPAPRPTSSIPTLSWEYWNGTGWVELEDIADRTAALTIPGFVTFACPEDLAMTSVVGQENFWIRARIAFGDYGQERVTFKVSQTDPNENVVVIDVSGIRPPEINSLKIGYQLATTGERPQYVLTLNNLAYSWLSFEKSIAPFVALDDDAQSLYLGFDVAPLRGPISIFFSLQEQEYTEANRPNIQWEYFRRQKGQTRGEWTRLLISDGTQNLTQSGTIEFIGPTDFAQLSRFGKDLFWIRAVDTRKQFKAKGKSVLIQKSLKFLAAGQSTMTSTQTGLFPSTNATPPGPKSCDQATESLSSLVQFPVPATSEPLAPIVQGVYLNTAWGVQAETIEDELLGSSDGSANQQFTLTKAPVMDESTWVNELATLTETERTALTEQREVRIRKDAEDAVVEFLVRWSPIDDIAQARPLDRVYEIDRTFGLIKFGDGVKHGMVPPIGRDNIKVTYRTGGGSRGNVAAKLIKSLRSTIPLVESASNPEAAGGGSDTELIENALARGPQVIKNRRRAITNEDFEWLAKEASQAIARAKCLPTFNDQGKYETGWVTVIIVPSSNATRPLPSPQLRQRVEKYLRDHGANVASSPLHIKVIPPVYVAVKVEADIYPQSLDLAPQVESTSIAKLQGFLHPLSGGYDKSGWDFGRVPCLSDFYQLLEALDGVDHVENLSLTLQAKTLLGESSGNPVLVREDRPLDVGAPPFTLIYSGEHKITIKSPITMLAERHVSTATKSR